MATVWIYESEIRSIAHETFEWDLETGGDLFGFWEPEPLVLLATRLGPNGERNADHCRFDLSFLRQLSAKLQRDWGLLYFGDWHSHPRKSVMVPSQADRQRIRQIAERKHFPRMIECIVTHRRVATCEEGTLFVRAFGYERPNWRVPADLEINVLPGISPVREVLVAQHYLPDQRLAAWESVSRARIACLRTDGPADRTLSHSVTARCGSHLRCQLICRLAAAFQRRVEDRPAAFGRILLLGDQGGQIALGLGAEWPHSILQIDQVPEGLVSSVPMAAMLEGITALNPAGVVELCQVALAGGLSVTTSPRTGHPLIHVAN